MIEAIFWLAVLSSSWLAAQILLWAGLLQALFAFPALQPAAWRQLYGGFLAGGTVRFDFVATVAAALTTMLLGQALLLWRLPVVMTWLPPLPSWPAARWRPEPPPSRPPTPPRPTSAPAPAAPSARSPSVAAAPVDDGGTAAGHAADSAGMARMLALLDVWTEPAPDWMRDALRDEVSRISDQGWPLLRDLGAAGLRLAVLLEAQGLLPARPAVVEFVTALLAPASAPPSAAASAGEAKLTLGAAWLCELVENFHGGEGPPVADLLDRAMRAMSAADWASLDRFPERAGRVRVATDRLAEEIRRGGQSAPPATRLIETLLRPFGFAITRPADQLVLAERDGLILLLQAIDLAGRRWRLPQGPSGPWRSDLGDEMAPGRVLWRRATRMALQRPGTARWQALLVVHDGALTDQAALSTDPQDDLAVVWLREAPGASPHLQQRLERLTAIPRRATAREATAPPA